MRHVSIVITILTLIAVLTVCSQTEAAQTRKSEGSLAYTAGSLKNTARAFALPVEPTTARFKYGLCTKSTCGWFAL